MIRKIVPPHPYPLKILWSIPQYELFQIRITSLVHLHKHRGEKLLTSIINGLKIIVSILHIRRQLYPKGTVLKGWGEKSDSVKE